MTLGKLDRNRARKARIKAFEQGLAAVRQTPKQDRILILDAENRVRFVTSKQAVNAALARTAKARDEG